MFLASRFESTDAATSAVDRGEEGKLVGGKKWKVYVQQEEYPRRLLTLSYLIERDLDSRSFSLV
jgi:hypothetical protein